MKHLLLFLPFLVTPAMARIGETLEQCRARYGKEVAVSPDSLRFVKEGIAVNITFWKDHASTIRYSRGGEEFLNTFDVEVLLKANGGDSEWRQADINYKTVKGRPLTARFTGGILLVEDQEALARRREEDERKKKERAGQSLKDF